MRARQHAGDPGYGNICPICAGGKSPQARACRACTRDLFEIVMRLKAALDNPIERDTFRVCLSRQLSSSSERTSARPPRVSSPASP